MRIVAFVVAGGLLAAACSADPGVRAVSSAQTADVSPTERAPADSSVPSAPEPPPSQPDDEVPSALGDPASDDASFEGLLVRGRSSDPIEYQTNLIPDVASTTEIDPTSTAHILTTPIDESDEPAATIMSMAEAPRGAVLVGAHQEAGGSTRAAIWEVQVSSTVALSPPQLLGPEDSTSVAEHAAALDGVTHVVGHTGTPESPAVWTIADDRVSLTMLDAPDGTIARRIASGDDGTLWVLGEQPGDAGLLLVWTSTDGGLTWSEPYSQTVSQWIDPYAIAVGGGLAVVSWDAAAASLNGQYRVRWFAGSSGGNPPELASVLPLDMYPDDLIDVRKEGDSLQILERVEDAVAVLTWTPDGTWERELRGIRTASWPASFGRIAGNDVFVYSEGGPYDATVRVLSDDGPAEVLAEVTLRSAFYTRLLDFPAVDTSEGLLILDPGTSDAPVLWKIDDSGTIRTELDIAPHRRRIHERVVDLTSDGVRTMAVVDSSYESSPGSWQPMGDRLMIVDPVLGVYASPFFGQEILVEHTTVGTVVGVANDGFTEWYLVESFDPASVPAPLGFTDGIAIRLVLTSDGAAISTFDGRSYVSRDLVDWTEVDAVRGRDGSFFVVENLCTHDHLLIGIGAIAAPDGSQAPWVAARTGSMWLPLLQLEPGLLDDSAIALCAVGESDLTISYRRPSGNKRLPESVRIDLDRLSVAPDGASTAADFADRFHDAGVTTVERLPGGWVAAGGSLDADGSEDAVAWIGDYQDAASAVTLATGPGLQEARTLLVTDDAVLVGGTDNGIPVIWTVTGQT